MEKLIEGIIFGIPRPVRAYFFISIKKTNELVPKQKKIEIDFCLKEFNQYNTSLLISINFKFFSTKYSTYIKVLIIRNSNSFF